MTGGRPISLPIAWSKYVKSAFRHAVSVATAVLTVRLASIMRQRGISRQATPCGPLGEPGMSHWLLHHARQPSILPVDP